MESVEAAILAIENGEYVKLKEFVYTESGRTKRAETQEFLQSLTKKQTDRLWLGLMSLCAKRLEHEPPIFPSEDEEDAGNMAAAGVVDEALSVIHLVTCLLRCAVDQEKPCVLDTVIQLAILLHGVLTVLPESAQDIQNSILQLFELWWSRDLSGKEELISMTVPCLVARTLADDATLSDIKRVWGIRPALCLFDYDQESSAPLKKLLTACLIHPRYLSSEDGVRFLAFLFGLHPDLVDALHMQIKQSLRGCSKDEVLAYGEVYFRAWKMASGIYLERIEYGCIQDLMHAAVHVSRVGTFSMAARLRMVLSLFHQEKQAKTDEALCRLYEPILWRAVMVANPHVRANASILLSDAFPLQNPQATVEETDTLLQKQLDILASLLEDCCSLVRAVTVTGVCHILQIFWETIPPIAVEDLLEKIRSLAADSSSGSVRAAVFSGLSRLVENRLTHTVLEQLLPKLRCHIHDTSQAVRIAFLDLLIAAKGPGTIKFWCIVPTDHLLYRLECDGPPVSRRIMKLLSPHLLPLNRTPEQQIDRCVALLQENRRAARLFYTLAAGQLSVTAASRFVQVLCKCVLRLLGECNDGVYLGDDVTVENEEVVAGLLEVMAVMLAVLFPRLNKGSRSAAKDRLVQLFSKALPLFLNHFKKGDARTAILVMSSYLPLDSVEEISEGCLDVLKDMNSETPVSSYGPVIECLTSWGHSKDVLDLVISWLQGAINGHGQTSKSGRRASRRLAKKAREKDENTSPNSMDKCDDMSKAELAIQLMSWIMKHLRSKTAAMQQRHSLNALISALKPAIDECDTKMTRCCVLTQLSDRCLVDAIALYSKLNIHLIRGDNEDENLSETPLDNISSLLLWAKNVVLPQLCTSQSNQKTSEPLAKIADGGGRKRKLFKKGGTTLDSDVSELTSKKATHQLAEDLTETVLVIGTEVVTLGLDNHDFCEVVTDFSVQLMQTQSGGQFLPHLCKLLYQFSQRLTSNEDISSAPVNGDEESPDLVSVLLQHLLKLMTREVNNPNTNILKVFLAVKPAIVECLVSSHRHYMTSLSPCLPSLTPMATVMMAIVVDISQTLSEDTRDQLCESVEDLPPLSIFLLSAVNHIARLREFFLMQLVHAICQDAFQTVSHVVAILNILTVLSSGQSRRSGLLEAFSAVENQLKKDSFRERLGADQVTRAFKLLRTQLS